MNEFQPEAFLRELASGESPYSPYVIDGFLALLALSFFLLLRKWILRFIIPEQTEGSESDLSALQAAELEADYSGRLSEGVAVTAASPSAPVYRNLPQDSVLRRHYLNHVRYLIESTSVPMPTESVLRRHHEQLISSQLEAVLNDAAELARLEGRYEAQRGSLAEHNAPTPPKREAVSPPIQLRRDKSAHSALFGDGDEGLAIPEEAVSRRDDQSHARYLLESIHGPCPTDSVLRRHHEHLIESELDACLLDSERMQALVRRYEAQRRKPM